MVIGGVFWSAWACLVLRKGTVRKVCKLAGKHAALSARLYVSCICQHCWAVLESSSANDPASVDADDQNRQPDLSYAYRLDAVITCIGPNPIRTTPDYGEDVERSCMAWAGCQDVYGEENTYEFMS